MLPKVCCSTSMSSLPLKMLIEFLREDDMDRDDVASVIEFCFSVINAHLMVFWIMLKYKLKAFLFSFLNVWLCYFY